MSTVGAVGRNDARSRACILCAHHPDILYLPFNNCFTGVCICVCVGIEGVASIGRQGESRGRWGGTCGIVTCSCFIQRVFGCIKV